MSMKRMAGLLYWVGFAILVVGVISGGVADVSQLVSTPFSGQSVALLFGQIASPLWEGLLLMAVALVLRRLSGES
ncbi:MAG: hypothetical protein OWU84_07655 [Firmicutes bacterium]|nr:hypothetical protein [Bacillota bacterium]